MKRFTADEFLKLPSGPVFIDREGSGVGLCVKGETNEDGSFNRTISLVIGGEEGSNVIGPYKPQEGQTFDVLEENELELQLQLLMDANQAYRENHRRKVAAKVYPIAEGAVHIDEWLDRPPMFFKEEDQILNYVHFFFLHARMPATYKAAYQDILKDFQLYVTYEGIRWRVMGASRLGDVWLTRRFGGEAYYDADGRVPFDLSKFSNWSRES